MELLHNEILKLKNKYKNITEIFDARNDGKVLYIIHLNYQYIYIKCLIDIVTICNKYNKKWIVYESEIIIEEK